MSTPRDLEPGLAELGARSVVLALCGYSGSGKTTLLTQLIPRLISRGLRVAVLKHDAHGAQVDTPGKDSARFFDAGADVYLSAPEQGFYRAHPQQRSLSRTLRALLASHDLVLVEGHKDTPLPKLWLAHPDDDAVPTGVTQVLRRLAWDQRNAEEIEAWLAAWLRQSWTQTPLLGGLLLGGQSRRMGQPKHLIRNAQGQTWIEAAVHKLAPRVEQVVLLGEGDVPSSLRALPRLSDVRGCVGPLAGLLSALRWAPQHAWLLLACDMPDVDDRALAWLLSQRAPGRWMIVPEIEPGQPEPLCAVYDFRARGAVEQLVERGRRAPRELRGRHGWYGPQVPVELAPAWRNVNTPQDL